MTSATARAHRGRERTQRERRSARACASPPMMGGGSGINRPVGSQLVRPHAERDPSLVPIGSASPKPRTPPDYPPFDTNAATATVNARNTGGGQRFATLPGDRTRRTTPLPVGGSASSSLLRAISRSTRGLCRCRSRPRAGPVRNVRPPVFGGRTANPRTIEDGNARAPTNGARLTTRPEHLGAQFRR